MFTTIKAPRIKKGLLSKESAKESGSSKVIASPMAWTLVASAGNMKWHVGSKVFESVKL